MLVHYGDLRYDKGSSDCFPFTVGSFIGRCVKLKACSSHPHCPHCLKTVSHPRSLTLRPPKVAPTGNRTMQNCPLPLAF